MKIPAFLYYQNECNECFDVIISLGRYYEL